MVRGKKKQMKKSLSQEERRNELAVKVLHDLAVNRRKLPAVAPDGSRPIVVALDEELLTAVFARVRVCGKSANLFVELAANLPERPVGEVVLFLATVGRSRTSKAEVFSDSPMHADTTIGMMAEYVLNAPDGVQMKVELPKFGVVEYVDRRDLVSA
jgi:hypothetical protein